MKFAFEKERERAYSSSSIAARECFSVSGSLGVCVSLLRMCYAHLLSTLSGPALYTYCRHRSWFLTCFQIGFADIITNRVFHSKHKHGADGKKSPLKAAYSNWFFCLFRFVFVLCFWAIGSHQQRIIDSLETKRNEKKNNRFIRSRHYNNGGTSSTSNLYNDIRITFDSIKSHFCVLSLSGPHDTHTQSHISTIFYGLIICWL